MAKKSFKSNNPALQFMTIQEESPSTEIIDRAEPGAAETTSEADAPAKDNTHDTQNTHNTQKAQGKKTELKGKRFNLLFYSTDTLESLKKIATMNQAESVNALINEVLTAYIIENEDKIDKYNAIFDN